MLAGDVDNSGYRAFTVDNSASSPTRIHDLFLAGALAGVPVRSMASRPSAPARAAHSAAGRATRPAARGTNDGIMSGRP